MSGIKHERNVSARRMGLWQMEQSKTTSVSTKRVEKVIKLKSRRIRLFFDILKG